LADTPTGDYAICRQHWSNVIAGLQAEFGPPASNTSNLDAAIQSQQLKYSFADGEAVDASILGCLIMVSYEKKP
jgi:hypothetical protein